MAKRQPEWIVERPYNNEYDIAISKNPRKAPNYVELARNNAILKYPLKSVQIDSDIAF